MKTAHEPQIRMIPLDQIAIVNSRERGPQKFAQIAANIRKLGLKRPITVVLNQRNGTTSYLLVCGQGRLEAYRAAGQTEVPAIIINVPKEDVLLMSLAENIARRRHTAAELVREIGKLKERGYTFGQIAEKTDLDISYVRGIITLLKNGEERLLTAVERREIPLYLAITIATSDDKQVQRALTEAYEKNTLRGKALIRARRLIELRRGRGKSRRNSIRPRAIDEVSSNRLLKVYEQETLKQKMIVQKARICETRLLFTTSALKQLFADPNFVTLLRAERLWTLPQVLATQIKIAET
jgi:ParB family chromosome partitioning protein